MGPMLVRNYHEGTVLGWVAIMVSKHLTPRWHCINEFPYIRGWDLLQNVFAFFKEFIGIVESLALNPYF